MAGKRIKFFLFRDASEAIKMAPSSKTRAAP